MAAGQVVTLEKIRSEQCMNEILKVLDKYQHDLIVDQHFINGTCVGTRIQAVPRQNGTPPIGG